MNRYGIGPLASGHRDVKGIPERRSSATLVLEGDGTEMQDLKVPGQAALELGKEPRIPTKWTDNLG